jgi:cobalt-zinc-cadmium efflux system outer membrane protein
VPLPLFRRNQGEIIEQQALNAEAEVTEQQARLRVTHEVQSAFAGWEQARRLAAQIADDLEGRLTGDAQALRDAYVRGTLPLPSALASLREVFGARRTVADARADAVLATLDLLTASGTSVTSPHPEDVR